MEKPRTFTEVVAAEVRAAMARRGMDQIDLARIIGRSQSTASNRWRGVHPFTVDELALIADACDVPVVQLVTPPPSVSEAA